MTKDNTARDIAIVFDNSGTMYSKDNLAWCRAQYAMEVFVDMANEEDEITIYPMNEIEVNGAKYTMDSPLKVRNSSQVHDIYTVSGKNGGTPIESLDRAYEGLMADTGDSEKWLVVLTDGARFYPEGGSSEMSKEETVAELSARFTSYNADVNLMYLGIDSPNAKEEDDKKAANPEVTSDGTHVCEVKIATESGEILEKLTEMCNLMYGRDTLDESHSHADGTVEFDLSMTKLILFVQGSNISNLKLVNEQGNEVGTPVSSYSPQYATMEDYAFDSDLSGQIVTYENIPAGTYTLSYDGNASSEEVYYEPNASIYLALTDENGEDVLAENGGEIYPGTYQLQYGLVDENGNLTDSGLLGNRNFTIAINGQTAVKEENLSDVCGTYSIDLEEGDDLFVEVDADYLSGYHVHTDSDVEWSQYQFQVLPEYEPYELSVDIQAEPYYMISKLDEAEPIEVLLTHDGEALTPEQMAMTELEFDAGDLDSSDWNITKDAENSRFLIEPQAEKSDAGTYQLAATATTYVENNREYVQAESSQLVQLGNYPRWIRWLIALVIILLIIVIILIIRNQKVLPKQITVDNKKTKFMVNGEDVSGAVKPEYKGGKKTAALTIKSPNYPPNPLAKCSITLNLEAVDPRKTKSNMRAALVKEAHVFPEHSMETYKVGAVSFSKDPETNRFKKSGAKAKKEKEGQEGKDASLDIRLTNNQKCTIQGEVMDESGMSVPITLTVTLKYL